MMTSQAGMYQLPHPLLLGKARGWRGELPMLK